MSPVSPIVRLQITVADHKVSLMLIRNGLTLHMPFCPPPAFPRRDRSERNVQERDKEVIRRVSKSYEVVEVDGFVFQRKRRGTVSAPAAADLTLNAEVHPGAAAHMESSIQASADAAGA